MMDDIMHYHECFRGAYFSHSIDIEIAPGGRVSGMEIAMDYRPRDWKTQRFRKWVEIMGVDS